MRLIGAGLMRTATSSQKVALETLGLRTYHMVDLMADLDQCALWERAEAGEDVWDELMAGRDATVDWPGARYFEPLMEKHPDAKVLLSVRDHASWERSMRDTICRIYFGDEVMHHLSNARILIDPHWADWIALMNKMCWEGRGPLREDPESTEGLIASAKAWDEHVKATVPADRLIVWEAKDGWAPICEALELPVPDEPFPRVNDTEGFNRGLTGGAIKALTAWFEGEAVPEASHPAAGPAGSR